MGNEQLELIRSYCDTSGYRLNSFEKDLLCKVLMHPEVYDGYETEVYTERRHGRDYRDTWDSETNWQYRINIDSSLSIDKRYRHECDGYVQDEYWSWDTAWHITDVRRILEVLIEIEEDL